MRYTDFTLLAHKAQIVKAEGRKRVAFELVVPGVFDEPLPREIADLRVLAGLVDAACKGTAQWRDALALGIALAELLLPTQVWNALNLRITQAQGSGEGVRVRLLLSGAALNKLPWEFILFNRGGGEAKVSDFLALHPNVSLVRHTAAPLPAWRVQAAAPLKLALAAASPAGGWPKLQVDDELALIGAALPGHGQRFAVEVTTHLQRHQLPDKTRPAHLFHFAGHGQFDTTTTIAAAAGATEGRGGLVLEDAYGDPDVLDAELLAVQLRDAGVRVAVLGACSTAQRDDVNAWSSVAETLLKAELGAVLGMQLPVLDESAKTFAARFYATLALGVGIDEAVAAGRIAVAALGDARGWATPALYLRAPDGEIFTELAADPALDEPRAVARQAIEQLRGQATNVRIGVMAGGHLEGEQKAQRVAPGGDLRNVEVGTMSGGSATATQTVADLQRDGVAVNLSIGRMGAAGAATPARQDAARDAPVAAASPAAGPAPASRGSDPTGAAAAPPSPTSPFDDLVSERTRHFVGREWVFDAIDGWLGNPHDRRIFLLTGGPGSGKTAVAARLVQMHLGQQPCRGRTGPLMAVAPGCLAYHHFCQASLPGTLAPLGFVEGLAQALANRYPECRRALEEQGSQHFHIESKQTIGGSVAPGATAIATQIGVTVQILGGDARPLFDRMVRRPLLALAKSRPDLPVTVLVDSLDEALTFSGDHHIVQLLQLVSDFPAQVRFMLTCRSRAQRVFDLVGQPTLDLIDGAPSGLDEVRTYAASRLDAVAEPARSEAARRVAEKSKGNFLYAYHVVNGLLRTVATRLDAALDDLPSELEDVYRQFLRRELKTSARWNDIYRPLLGLVAVARGEGLTRSQLIGITGLAEDTADDVLSTCEQYLVGGGADRPYRIYHQSFREFLLDDPVYGVYPAERHASIARWLQDRCGASWATCSDDYALRHTPSHWADAVERSTEQRSVRTQALVELTCKPKYQLRFEQRLHDLPALADHLRRAVSAAALNEAPDMLPWLIRAAQGSVRFRDQFLRADAVLRPADEGKLEQAEERLRLFGDIGEDWHAAARLVVAWLGAGRNPQAAAQWCQRVVPAGAASGVLARLAGRVAAALRGEATVACESWPAASPQVVTELVKRLSGQAFDRELLQDINPSLLAVGPELQVDTKQGYVAAVDAPILVGTARAFPVEGTQQIDLYVDAHAGYNYVEYRNRSLWFVLDAVLRHHPDQDWVLQRLRRVVAVALAGGGADFRETLPLAAAMLREAAASRSAAAFVEPWRAAALDAARRLEPSRGRDDPWGHHKRRLTGLMTLYALALGDRPAAEALLEDIGKLPGGFAGFQAPAALHLADALRACHMDSAGLVAKVLDDALRAAHHIQDHHFCARVTARCNALGRWHATPMSGADLAAAIGRLAASPGDAEFQADHRIHEPFAYREPDDHNLLSVDAARMAGTLDELVEVFQRPAVEFRRLNPDYGLDTRIAGGIAVVVPDPGLAPLLAVHLAARALADDALAERRVALLRSLVPVATTNPTALDTLAAWLVVASGVDDTDVLDEIVAAAGPVAMHDTTAPQAQVGPDAVMPA